MAERHPTGGCGPACKRCLAEGAQRRDPDAWDDLYRLVYPRLFAFARNRVSDDTDAEDVVSETMTRALHGIDRFRWRNGVGIEAWLFGIGRNVLHEHHRRARRTSPSSESVIDLGASADPTTEPAARVEADEEAQAVRRALHHLRHDDREILELRFVAGLSAPEIAHVIGRRAGAVRMAQSRALDRLRHLLQEGGEP